jgi:hypothetical protein
MAWVNNQTISCISFQVGNACWISSTWMSCIFEEVLWYAGPKQIHNAAKMGISLEGLVLKQLPVFLNVTLLHYGIPTTFQQKTFNI